MTPTKDCTPSKDHICPECKAGKHTNCDGSAWCNALDRDVFCYCDSILGHAAVTR